MATLYCIISLEQARAYTSLTCNIDTTSLTFLILKHSRDYKKERGNSVVLICTLASEGNTSTNNARHHLKNRHSELERRIID